MTGVADLTDSRGYVVAKIRNYQLTSAALRRQTLAAESAVT